VRRRLERVSAADAGSHVQRKHAELRGRKLRSDPVRRRVPDELLLQWDELCRGQRHDVPGEREQRDVRELLRDLSRMHRLVWVLAMWMQL
jgi:hypothetical protein